MLALDWRSHAVGHCTHPACMVRRGAGWRAQAFPSQAFRITHPRLGHLLFDTGYTRHFLDATRRLPECLYRMVTPVYLQAQEDLVSQLAGDGIQPGDIHAIVLSHLHGDHIGGLRDFPGVPVWCAREAITDLRRRGRLSALRIGLLPRLLDADFEQRCRWIEDASIRALSPPFTAFATGHDLLGDGSLLAVALPGHAAGHHGLLFRDATGWVFLIADAAWSLPALRDGVPPPALTTRWLGDSAAYRNTFDALHALATQADATLRIVPSHCTRWQANG